MSLSPRWSLLPLGVALIVACGEDPPPKSPNPTVASSSAASGGGGNTGNGGDEGGTPSSGGGPVTSANGGNGGTLNQGGDAPGCLHCADTLEPGASGNLCNSSVPISSALNGCMCGFDMGSGLCTDECNPATCIQGNLPDSGCQACLESDCATEYNACIADDGS